MGRSVIVDYCKKCKQQTGIILDFIHGRNGIDGGIDEKRIVTIYECQNCGEKTLDRGELFEHITEEELEEREQKREEQEGNGK